MKKSGFFLCFWAGLYLSMPLFLPVSASFAADKTTPSQHYFSVLPDIPLMPNMVELDDQSYIFDKAEGRVIESAGFLSVDSRKNITSFYQSALKELGWNPLKNNVFQRGNEILSFEINDKKNGFRVKFQLQPVSR